MLSASSSRVSLSVLAAASSLSSATSAPRLVLQRDLAGASECELAHLLADAPPSSSSGGGGGGADLVGALDIVLGVVPGLSDGHEEEERVAGYAGALFSTW